MPNRPPEVTFDLTQRLSDQVLSQAWLHLHLALHNPATPIPPELAHLTEPEWHLCAMMLSTNEMLRSALPLH